MPLTGISLSFILGIIFASLISLPPMLWLALSAVVVAFIIFIRFIRLPQGDPVHLLTLFSFRPFYYVLLIAFLLGAWRYRSAQPNIDAFHIAFYNDRSYEMLITGTLAGPPDYRDTYTNLKIDVEAIDSGDGDLPASGYLLVRVAKNEAYEYGERVRLRGFLKTPPESEEFSYRDYLAREGVHSYMSSAEVTRLPGNEGKFIYRLTYYLKTKLVEHTYRLFNDPEASLLAGILFGVDTGLTRELQNAFKNTGTAHIIAISGFNIAIIGGIFFTMFKILLRSFLPEYFIALLAVIGIFFYAFLVGGDAAVMRAAFMGSVALAARQLGQRTMGLNALMGVALVMALGNPLVIWDVGFQLSFFATLGLILYAEPLSNFTARLVSRIWKDDTIIRIINDSVMLTIAAQITTIPIMIYHFKRLSLVSFIANPFILPVQPAVMVLGLLAVVTSLFIFPLGQLLAWVAWPFATYTIRMVELFDRIPHGTLYLGDSSFWWAVGFYAVLLSVTFNWQAINERILAVGARLRALAFTAAFAFLFICMTLLWRSAASAGDGQLHITFLDVSSADAILVQTPEGRNVLINGGPSAAGLSDELGRRLPFFSRRLDWLVIASTDEDDVSALPRVVERYPPESVLWSGNIQASFSSQMLDKYFAEEGIPVTRAEAGEKLELGDGAFIEVQAEGPRGSVLLLQYGNFSALLPLGVNEETYETIEYGNTVGTVDVFLLADAGYGPSNPPDILENVNPQLVVLSVAAGDPDGLPAEEVLESIEGYSMLRTDRSGWISVITDGHEMRVEVERAE
jgi:competence protein ComEC